MKKVYTLCIAVFGFAFLSNLCNADLWGQNISGGLSTISDPNIFNIHTPQSDQITLLQLGVSKGWDIDNETLDFSYNGNLFLFNVLPSRSYHTHEVILNSTYQFYSDDEDDSQDDADTLSNDVSDSAQVVKHITQPVVHADSADRFLNFVIDGMTQIDKVTYNEFDNSRISGTLILRQPIALAGSFRPTYMITYHNYPNIKGISNIENQFGGMIGMTSLNRAGVLLSAFYGIKNYSNANYEYTYTIVKPNKGGHGKGGAGGGTIQQTSTIDLTTPSVDQFNVTLGAHDSIFSATTVSVQSTYFGLPSSEARLLPEQLSSVLERQGIGTDMNAENEIFDDHYGYSGMSFSLGISQNLPWLFVLGGEVKYQQKNYTIPAEEFDSTITTRENRSDRRVEGIVSLSRLFPFSSQRTLKLITAVGYLHNTSNVLYYEFEKTTFSAGIEFFL